MAQPLAFIHPDAKIGSNVTIEPFAVIDGNVEIGDGTFIGAHAVIRDGARIGRDCRIFPGAVIAGIPQDLKFKGEDTVAVIGDRTTLRECVTVNRGTSSRGHTLVGSDCLIMAYSHVAHDCEVGNGVIISNASQLAGEVIVDDFAVIGGGSLIHQFCHIGSYIMMQGGALVNKDIPPFVLAAREPISYTGVNVIGMKRRGFTNGQIAEAQEVYRLLYRNGLNITEAVANIEAQMAPTPIRDLILNFVKSSSRGILRG